MPTKSNHVTRVGIGKAILNKSGTWDVDLRVQGIPTQEQRKRVKTKALAIERLKFWTEWLKNHGSLGEDFIDYFTKDERFMSRKLVEEFRDEHPDYTLDQLLATGIEIQKQRIISDDFPTLSEWIDEYQSKRKVRINKHQLSQEQLVFDLVKIWFGELRLNDVFKPETRFKKQITPKMHSEIKVTRGINKGKSVSGTTLVGRAKAINKMLNEALEDYPDIVNRNPINKGWHNQFREKFNEPPKMLSADDVQKLFDAAVSNEKWTECIPYMALTFYGAVRPSEVSGDESYRKWDWSNMIGWEEVSSVSGGLLINVPPSKVVDGKRKRMSKSDTWKRRDLFPCGVSWLKWYFLEFKEEKELPNNGKIEFHWDRWKKLRLYCGLQGEGVWVKDSARHTYVSCAHRLYPSEHQYWLMRCGHSESVYLQHYQDPEATTAIAGRFFGVLPPNEIERRKKAKQLVEERWIAKENQRVAECTTYRVSREEIIKMFGLPKEWDGDRCTDEIGHIWEVE